MGIHPTTLTSCSTYREIALATAPASSVQPGARHIRVRSPLPRRIRVRIVSAGPLWSPSPESCRLEREPAAVTARTASRWPPRWRHGGVTAGLRRAVTAHWVLAGRAPTFTGLLMALTTRRLADDGGRWSLPPGSSGGRRTRWQLFQSRVAPPAVDVP